MLSKAIFLIDGGGRIHGEGVRSSIIHYFLTVERNLLPWSLIRRVGLYPTPFSSFPLQPNAFSLISPDSVLYGWCNGLCRATPIQTIIHVLNLISFKVEGLRSEGSHDIEIRALCQRVMRTGLVWISRLYAVEISAIPIHNHIQSMIHTDR